MRTPESENPAIRRALQEAFDGQEQNTVPVQFTSAQERDRRFHIEDDDEHQQPYPD